MEWDTAAGDAVLRAAGGLVLRATAGRFTYGKTEADYRNGAFVAWGDKRPSSRRDAAGKALLTMRWTCATRGRDSAMHGHARDMIRRTERSRRAASPDGCVGGERR